MYVTDKYAAASLDPVELFRRRQAHMQTTRRQIVPNLARSSVMRRAMITGVPMYIPTSGSALYIAHLQNENQNHAALIQDAQQGTVTGIMIMYLHSTPTANAPPRRTVSYKRAHGALCLRRVGARLIGVMTTFDAGHTIEERGRNSNKRKGGVFESSDIPPHPRRLLGANPDSIQKVRVSSFSCSPWSTSIGDGVKHPDGHKSLELSPCSEQRFHKAFSTHIKLRSLISLSRTSICCARTRALVS